jgi:hypothetical protein
MRGRGTQGDGVTNKNLKGVRLVNSLLPWQFDREIFAVLDYLPVMLTIARQSNTMLGAAHRSEGSAFIYTGRT